MNRDEAQRRDLAVHMIAGAKTWLESIRKLIEGSPEDGGWSEPLPENRGALAVLDDIFSAYSQLEEFLHGDLDDRMQRWLSEPGQRSDLPTAVKAAGVGGIVRLTLGAPTDLDKRSLDYQVMRINRCSVRLRDQGNLSEVTRRFDRWDSPRVWSVVDGETP